MQSWNLLAADCGDNVPECQQHEQWAEARQLVPHPAVCCPLLCCVLARNNQLTFPEQTRFNLGNTLIFRICAALFTYSMKRL